MPIKPATAESTAPIIKAIIVFVEKFPILSKIKKCRGHFFYLFLKQSL
jgi:hypothetical protein